MTLNLPHIPFLYFLFSHFSQQAKGKESKFNMSNSFQSKYCIAHTLKLQYFLNKISKTHYPKQKNLHTKSQRSIIKGKGKKCIARQNEVNCHYCSIGVHGKEKAKVPEWTKWQISKSFSLFNRRPSIYISHFLSFFASFIHKTNKKNGFS